MNVSEFVLRYNNSCKYNKNTNYEHMSPDLYPVKTTDKLNIFYEKL